MDYDNDGIQDFISGSYDPGDIYLFRGLGGGKYAAAAQISDETGAALVHHPEEFREYTGLSTAEQTDRSDAINLRVASFGSWPATVDWENDGDLDILIGSFSGQLFLRRNTGSREHPEYDADAVPVLAAGEPLRVNMHAAPAVADWDTDGTWDLVVGSGDGAVGWFRNTGSKSEPQFGLYQPLVRPASDTKFFEQILNHGEQPTHGARAQICVTDYNLDGRPDLIVGDYSDISWLRDLTDSERDELADLRAKRDDLIRQSQALLKQFQDDWKNADFAAEREQISTVFARLDERQKPYFKESRSASFVWVFLRQDADTTDVAAQNEPANASSRTVPVAATETQDAHPSDTGGQDSSGTEQLTLLAVAEPVDGIPDEYDVSVSIFIQSGWHLYSSVPPNSPHRVTTIEFTLPEGVTTVGPTDRPAGFPSPQNASESIYTDLVTFTQRVRSENSGQAVSMKVVVNYEVCNADYCLPVDRLIQTVELNPP
ncbi:MAG: VCBS repeat-containing protein [Planctomycetaceae bacterium]|nr:VCBS repeat-containing protein [Planctomycetaceae bacterium]